MSLRTEQLTAEQRFRQAFERLKANRPKVLMQNTLVSQNNVAKEAGCDPSALKKSRFPSLIREIQAYIEIHTVAQPSKREALLTQRGTRRLLKDQINNISAQRDYAQSQLLSAHQRIVELTAELKLARSLLDELRPPPTSLNKSAITSKPFSDRSS